MLLRRKFVIKSAIVRNVLAEFYATAVLRFIGTGVMAQYVLSRGTFNSPIQVQIGWGFAILFGVYAGWSGHVNPAVTAVFWLLNKISLLQSVLYVIAQILEAINDFDGGSRKLVGVNGTGIIFASFPAPYLSNVGGDFIFKMAGTGILGLFVAYYGDSRNQVPLYLLPPLFFALCVAIGVSYGMNAGSAINPASDFGARLFAFFAGYGTEIFTHNNFYFLVPLIAPIFGALIAAESYNIFIGRHMPGNCGEPVSCS
ncbi:unnamed protein product [Dracunculus medinensis]|uniref:Aquaporin-9 n=1 Tax=Dracunculus medinensis TaxID=318479 RepID=A0A0N4U2X8_DRAME|nr:unnamed protein product [Dracunculus medinensis]